MDLSERIEHYGMPALYLLMAIGIAIPILHPLGLPIVVSEDTKTFYALVDSLKPGAIVHYGIDPEIGGFEELRSRMIAIGRQLFAKDARIVFAGFDPNAPEIYKLLINDIGVPKGKVYGVDYVFLGYIPGREIGIASYAKDVHALLSVDYFGTPLQNLPLMNEVKNIKDFSLVISFSSHELPINYIQQIYVPYHVRVAVVVIGVFEPTIKPYYPDQIVGFLSTPRQGAEYELLLHMPGIGVADFDAQTIAHAILLIFIVAGNLIVLKRRRSKRGR
jgi:hypothetical protein